MEILKRVDDGKSKAFVKVGGGPGLKRDEV